MVGLMYSIPMSLYYKTKKMAERKKLRVGYGLIKNDSILKMQNKDETYDYIIVENSLNLKIYIKYSHFIYIGDHIIIIIIR